MDALRILLVEDEAIMGQLLGEVLQGMGHVVCATETTEADAVAAVARCKPDLMLVDIQLGVGNGISAVEKILRNGFIPHVFYSGDISGVRTSRPSAVSIQKPFRVRELAEAIQRALDARVPA